MPSTNAVGCNRQEGWRGPISSFQKRFLVSFFDFCFFSFREGWRVRSISTSQKNMSDCFFRLLCTYTTAVYSANHTGRTLQVGPLPTKTQNTRAHQLHTQKQGNKLTSHYPGSFFCHVKLPCGWLIPRGGGAAGGGGYGNTPTQRKRRYNRPSENKTRLQW